MARPEIDPTLQLRNQESIRLTDTELVNINKALEILNTRNGFKISRSAFLKSSAMRAVNNLVDLSPHTPHETLANPKDKATSPEAKATSPTVKKTSPAVKKTSPAVKKSKASVKATSPAVKNSKKRGAK